MEKNQKDKPLKQKDKQLKTHCIDKTYTNRDFQ